MSNMEANLILRRVFNLPIKVHSWGGYGSQLFTAYLVLKLQEMQPRRRIKVVVHTSGVTRRSIEFNFRDLGVEVIERDDFVSSFKIGESSRQNLGGRLVYLLKIVFKRVLTNTHLVESANCDSSVKAIKPWTLSIRGHYTLLKLEYNIVERLFSLILKQNEDSRIRKFYFVLHYRLGDLLSLEQKSPITARRIESLIDRAGIKLESAILLTDSDPVESHVFLRDEAILRSLEIESFEPRATLLICAKADVFAGTNAKLSLWAAIFRQYVFRNRSYLPLELSWAQTKGLDLDGF